jgi:hypothetical protein
MASVNQSLARSENQKYRGFSLSVKTHPSLCRMLFFIMELSEDIE